MGVRDLQAPWQRKRAFRHGVSKKPDERQGIFHRAFYCAGLLPYSFPKKGENWIALGNQNELRVESLEKEFGRSSSLHIGYQMDRTEDVIVELFLKIISKKFGKGAKGQVRRGGAVFFNGVSFSPSHTPPHPFR